MLCDRVIRVFLASSDELKTDRVSFGDFIRRLDDIYELHGVRLKLFKWEEYDAAYNGEPKQGEYDKKILTTDLFVGFFLRKKGKYTVHELRAAQNIFQESESARICIFFKEPENEAVVLPELEEFKEDLANNDGYSGIRYRNCETLFLHFVMQLQLMEMTNPVKIVLRESQLLVDDHVIVDMNQIPFVENNEEWVRIDQEAGGLKNEIAELKGILEFSPDNVALNKMLREKQLRYQKLRQLQDEQEQILYDTAFTIVKIQGHIKSERLQRTIELFEKGDSRGANALLCLEDINREIEANKTVFDETKEFTDALTEEKRVPVRSRIAEYRLKAQILLSDSRNPNRLAEACWNYERAVELAENCLHNEEYTDILFDYAYFLYHYKQVLKAIYYFEKLLTPCAVWLHRNRNFYLGKVLMIMSNLSGLYLSTNEFKQAESLCQEIIEIVQSLSEELYLKFFLFLPVAYTNLGIIYREENIPKAESMLLKALEMREQLAVDNADAYSMDLAGTLRELSTLYFKISRHEEAEKMALRALGYYEQHHLRNEACAMLKSNLGIFYHKCKRFHDAEFMFKDALVILERLVAKEPEAYLNQLAKLQQSMGNMYVDSEKIEQAETMYRKAFEIIEPLSEANPEIYLPELADFYNNTGIFYRKTGRWAKAEENYDKALEYFKKLAHQHPEAYLGKVAMIEFNLGNLYQDQDKSEEAEAHYLKALEIYQQLRDTNRAVYLPQLAEIGTKLGTFYFKMQEYKKCIKSMGEALIVWHALAEKHPLLYTLEEGKAFLVLGEAYGELEDWKQANEYLFCGVKIFNILSKDIPLEGLPFLGMGLRSLGALFEFGIKDPVQARHYYFIASETCEYFFQLNPMEGIAALKEIYEDMVCICRQTGEDELAWNYQKYAQKGEIISNHLKKKF